MSYNGWTNYETWAVKLWIDNEQGSQDFWVERAQDNIEQHADTAHVRLAEELKDYHEEYAPTRDMANVYSDLMNAALSSVNWHEIARSLCQDAAELL